MQHSLLAGFMKIDYTPGYEGERKTSRGGLGDRNARQRVAAFGGALFTPGPSLRRHVQKKRSVVGSEQRVARENARKILD